MNDTELVEKINKLKKERDAIILAHNYQRPEVQRVADIVGDSFALSKEAAKVDNKVIVFCGVRFMAESAKILSPDKTVLIPAADAGCPLSDCITPEQLECAKAEHPNATVVCYVNTSAEIKAMSDICCTSSNAVRVVESIDNDEILFVPDKNLGSYVAEKVKDKKIITYEGHCVIHNKVVKNDIDVSKKLHPNAEVLVHPEVPKDVCAAADFVGSTAEIIKHAGKSDNKEFIIGTELGVFNKLENDNPDKKFYLLNPCLVCVNMKKTMLEDVYNSLNEMKYEVSVPEDIRVKALSSLTKMLNIK